MTMVVFALVARRSRTFGVESGPITHFVPTIIFAEANGVTRNGRRYV
jgi:hypothetical protein